jgi:hypothetical protein
MKAAMTTTNLAAHSFLKTRKRGQMNRILGAIFLSLTLLAVSTSAWAQETTGRITGTVTDRDTNAPLAGVTVIVQGPQGEDATVTDKTGLYLFTHLSIGTYTVRFYLAATAAQVEQEGIRVSAEKTVRVNAKIASTAQAAAAQTYVITGQAPLIDVGSARIRYTFDQDFTLNVPVEPNYGAVIAKAPGAFVDGSGNVSIGGATGLENIYIVNGMNVTGMRYGSLEANQPSIAGGTNLPNEFLTQIDVNSGGYQAEYGGALGGVINSVLKSGSNEFHGQVLGSWAPYWLSAKPTTVTTLGSSIAGAHRRDFDDRIGFEVGGPIIKDKLFFWAGMIPQLIDSHVFRYTYALNYDAAGNLITDKNGAPTTTFLPDATRRANETRRIWNYAATLNYIPLPEHKLEFAIFGTPSFGDDVRTFNSGGELNSLFPSADGSGQATWPLESVTRTNTDVTAHWTSKLFDRHWQLEALGGFHNEYFYDRSPNASLNTLNQLQYSGNGYGPSGAGADLFTLEGIPGCENQPNGNPTCPVNPFYFRGGFGEIVKSNGTRWSGEIKSTHLFEAGGHQEVKYGWHLDLTEFDLDRNYSGPGGGANGLVWFQPDGSVSTQNFFRLKPNEFSADEGTTFPYKGLVDPADGRYVDTVHASVKSLINAFYLQDSYSPQFLRNLTINAGARYELQALYDLNGTKMVDLKDLAPRVGLIYDPFNDGRTRISAAYGQFYEAVPIDIAARYFGNENFVQRQNIPLSMCAPNTTIGSFVGAGEWANCGFANPDMGAYNLTNNFALAQPHIQGQFQNEVVATLERQVMEDMTVRLDYTHRWLGQVIEDGYGKNDFTLTDVIANPGNVPADAIQDAQKEVDNLQMQAMADPTNHVLQSEVANAQKKLNALQTFQTAPKAERTYDALTLSVNKRYSKNWLFRGAYTYSRLVGNYEGLYQAEQNYVAPNGTNAYDTPDLYYNTRGLLPNDRTHQIKLDGYYALPVGPGAVTLGLSFVGRSGMPRNYMSNLLPGANYQIVYLLPRGTAGRTPFVTQLDLHVAYGQKIRNNLKLEGFIDFFNVFDQQTTTMTDDNYTYDGTAAIVNGNKSDLAFAKNAFGAPITKNPNFGRPIAYQAPFYSRLGLRLMF